MQLPIIPGIGRVIFSHGHQSGPESRKIVALAPIAERAGFGVEAIDYRDLRDDPVARRDRLIGRIDASDAGVVLVGSSLGGWVSMAAAEHRKVAGLWLMAPALFLEDRVDGGTVPETYRPLTGRVGIVHGWRDEIIPCQNILRFAESFRAALHLIDDVHRLENSLPAITTLFKSFLHGIERGED